MTQSIESLAAALNDDDDTRLDAADIIDRMGSEIRDMVPAALRQHLRPDE